MQGRNPEGQEARQTKIKEGRLVKTAAEEMFKSVKRTKTKMTREGNIYQGKLCFHFWSPDSENHPRT
eukprot:1287786-Prorocentrum_lima.AAC.1